MFVQSPPLTTSQPRKLGGKNPCIVFDDVDVAATAPLVARSSFANQGEICLCSSRIYVQEGIFDAFLAAFVVCLFLGHSTLYVRARVFGCVCSGNVCIRQAEAEKIKVGDPAAKDTNMGAIVSKEHLAKVGGFVYQQPVPSTLTPPPTSTDPIVRAAGAGAGRKD